MRRVTDNEYGMALERCMEMSERIAEHEERLRGLKRDKLPIAGAERLLCLMHESHRVLRHRLELLAKDNT